MKYLYKYHTHNDLLNDELPLYPNAVLCQEDNDIKNDVHFGFPYDRQIEYLESDGISYINTGITPTLSYSVEMEFKWVSPWSSVDASGSLFGTMQGWNNNTFMFV